MKNLIVLPLLVLGMMSCTRKEEGPVEPVLRPERMEIRAYHGAPPTIPHEVKSVGRSDCAACHGPGQQAAGRVVAPVTPHPSWTQCTQCHVEQVAGDMFVANSLEGLAEPQKISMPSPFLPPYIPHRLDNFREEACETCHIGPGAALHLRPNHGPRGNCTQCHVPAYDPLAGFGVKPQGFTPEHKL